MTYVKPYTARNIYFTILTAFAFLATNANGQNLFRWDCESQTTSLGTFVNWHAYSELVDTESHTGQRSMQLTIFGDDGGNQSRGVDDPGAIEGAIINRVEYPHFYGGKWLFYRSWLKFSDDFSWGNGTAKTKSSRIIQREQVLPTVLTSFLHKDGFEISECVFCDPQNPFIDFDVQGLAGMDWHEFIIAIKRQQSLLSDDGEFHVFVDGQFIGKVTGIHYFQLDVPCTEAWAGWMVSPFFQLNGTPSDGGTVWVDDVSTDECWNSMNWPAPLDLPSDALCGSLLGDVNLDGDINLLDVQPFVDLIANSSFQFEADINADGEVDLLDVDPFVDLLVGP